MPQRIIDLVCCNDCGCYYHESEFDDWTESGLPTVRASCTRCREPLATKTCVDCFVCGAEIFFTEQQLEIRSNHGRCRVTAHPNGHNIIFKDRFVIACCWPIARVADMTEMTDTLIASLTITPDK